MKRIFFVLWISLLFACKGKENPSGPALPASGDSPLAIDVQIADTAFKHVESLLNLDRYVILQQDPALGDIVRVMIRKDRIYILDHLPQLVCYDMQGKLVYHIDSRGSGPQEFLNIIDFCIDPEAGKLIAYDEQKGKLIDYDLATGAFQKETDLPVSPMGIAFAHGSYLYDHADHRNCPDKKELHYSLLYSRNGRRIDRRFFPHDAVAEYDYNIGHGHPFFYNNDRLLYNNRFDKTVYSVEPDGPQALYEINLPNPVPLSIIEQKTDPLRLMESDYSSNLTDIFQCGPVLYFWFIRNRYYHPVFYDLRESRLIYCGKRIDNEPTKELPVYYRIQGVYRNCFFSLIEPEAILYKQEKNPDAFPAEWKSVSEMDNPILVFYKVVR